MDDNGDVEMRDSAAPTIQSDTPQEEDLDREFPNRPKNHNKTLPFHVLYQDLFDPLLKLLKGEKPTGPPGVRRKQGPWPKPSEARHNIIQRFFNRWRHETGNDIYPAFRLILPDKDRDRQVYGLKEHTIAKLLVEILGIGKNSEDAIRLLKWKRPASGFVTSAGDFPGACFLSLRNRAMMSKPGKLSVAEVNELLDQLSVASGKKGHLPIFRKLYLKMSAEEMTWIIRIILRQMKMGATEKTFFSIWHPDADDLFKVTSSLRRVCWDLYDPDTRLGDKDGEVKPMQCFQPQLAQFQQHNFAQIVQKMQRDKKSREFLIEEKLDGERMQMHMITDESVPGGKRFGFWSRKGKDYTYLYGESFHDERAALTRHLENVFADTVDTVILDGEMITWDPVVKAMVPFGTLKTAAIEQQSNPYHSTTYRPFFRIFDCLYLNGDDLTKYNLYDRRIALERAIRKPVDGRFEIHQSTPATTAEEIEEMLRKVIVESSEGLVVKNPYSIYSLNARNDSWIKVKPEYMIGEGENLDCIVIGAYFGNGTRGGRHASYLCGLRIDENQIRKGDDPMKCWSFFKVGGGIGAPEYRNIQHRTEGKWKTWDKERPPTKYVELAGNKHQYEMPDEWIKPDESVVLSVKGASVVESDRFRAKFSLRFPRLVKLRDDKDWKSALSYNEFLQLKQNAEHEHEKQLQIDIARKTKRRKTSRKKVMTIAGADDDIHTPYAGPPTNCLNGLTFHVMTESVKPKKSEAELKQLIKANGGTYWASYEKKPDIICIADRKLTTVHNLQKRGTHNIVRPSWILDCIAQSEKDPQRPQFIIPFEPRHMFYTMPEFEDQVAETVDSFGDSYTCDVSPSALREIMDDMPQPKEPFPPASFLEALESLDVDVPSLRGWTLKDLEICFLNASGEAPNPGKPHELRAYQACRLAEFSGAKVSYLLEDRGLTQVVICEDGAEARARAREVRREISKWAKLPKIVRVDWVEQCWQEKTWLDEEKFAIY